MAQSAEPKRVVIPRPKKSINQRFNDVTDLWTMATNNGGLRVPCASRSIATAMRHRLNRYRQLIREIEEDKFTLLDNYIIRIEPDNAVIVLPRPIFDLSKAQTLSGRPALPPGWQPGDPVDGVTLDDDTIEMPVDVQLDAKGIELRDAFIKAHPEYNIASPKPREHNPNKPLFGVDDADAIASDKGEQR